MEVCLEAKQEKKEQESRSSCVGMGIKIVHVTLLVVLRVVSIVFLRSFVNRRGFGLHKWVVY